MTATILKGTEVARAMEERLSSEVEVLRDLGVVPTLAIVRAGQAPENILFERNVLESAARVGIETRSIVLAENATQRELLLTIKDLNEDDAVHGILLCRPLPDHIDEDRARNMVEPLKDVDGMNDVSLGRMFVGNKTGYLPCTAQACMEVFDHYGFDLKGKNVVVVGRSLVVGRPVAMLLTSRNATVTITHSLTENLADITRKADIVILGVGSPKMFGSEFFSEGQAVIDVGTSFVDGGKLVGDADFDEVKEVVGAITTTPGGVAAVVTSTLVKHAVQAIKKLHGEMEIYQGEDGEVNARFDRN